MDEDATGEFLSKMIEQAETILAETVRISAFVGKDFREPSKSRFQKVLGDFKYFGRSEQFEKEMEKEAKLQTLFYSTHAPVITAFEQLFNLLPEFLQSFRKYSEVAGNSSIDRIGELEINLLYTTGLLLLNIEKCLPATSRERLYVAIYRRSDTRLNAEFLVDFLVAGNDPLIKRAAISVEFVRNCLTRLESWKHPQLQQFFYIALLFDKHTLDKDSTRMTRICSLVYREEWVFNIGYGIIINLFDAWYYNKSAWYAMNSIVRTVEANRLAEHHASLLKNAKLSTKMSDEISNLPEILRDISSFNTSLKWIILHSKSQRYKIIKNPPSPEQIFQWILEISKFEFQFLQIFKKNLKNRKPGAEEKKTVICGLLKKLQEFFEMGFVSVNVSQKENFLKWLNNLSDTVAGLELCQESSEVIQQIQRRLKQSSDLLGLATNFTIKEVLDKIDVELRNLRTFLNMSEKSKIAVLQKCAADYLWALMDCELIERIQQNLTIKGAYSSRQGNEVTAIFTKLGVSIGAMRIRLGELGVAEAACSRLMNCWSSLLERQLRRVLQIVPQHLFKTMRDVVLARKSRVDATFVEKSQVFDVCRNDRQVIRATFQFANMSQGISRMMMRRVGSVPINPKRLLEDGIERELYKEIKRIIGQPTEISKFLENLKMVEKMRDSFVYMCEFMSFDGHRIWTTVMEDYFGKLADGEHFMVEMVMKATAPKTSRFSDDLMVWKDVKGRKTQFSYDTIFAIERMLPFYASTSIETVLMCELESALKEHFQTCRKTWLAANVNINELEGVFKTPEYEKLVKQVNAMSGQLVTQVAQIGQILIVLKGIGEMKRICCRIQENRVYKELEICSRKLAVCCGELPAGMRNLLRLMSSFSIFDVEKLKFDFRDDPSPILIIALIQCVLTKIGDSNFVCPKQLEIGILFILQQSRIYLLYRQMIKEQLPMVGYSKKRREADGFMRSLVNYM